MPNTDIFFVIFQYYALLFTHCVYLVKNMLNKMTQTEMYTWSITFSKRVFNALS